MASSLFTPDMSDSMVAILFSVAFPSKAPKATMGERQAKYRNRKEDRHWTWKACQRWDRCCFAIFQILQGVAEFLTLFLFNDMYGPAKLCWNLCMQMSFYFIFFFIYTINSYLGEVWPVVPPLPLDIIDESSEESTSADKAGSFTHPEREQPDLQHSLKFLDNV